ncbi:hypothetical protein J43TS9_15450 [Paenibacillus cineris]|nr:hypothetical protein J43TS9_15450 [Paenibacillus cineris]
MAAVPGPVRATPFVNQIPETDVIKERMIISNHASRPPASIKSPKPSSQPAMGANRIRPKPPE